MAESVTTAPRPAARRDAGDLFAGRLFVAPVTPFRGPRLELDEDGYRALLEREPDADGRHHYVRGLRTAG